jgi:UDP-N-acetylglucosamine 4-epimerase
MISNSIMDQIEKKKVWVITGVAGFIGSHLLEFLLNHDQIVVGIDNFSTGSKENLKDVQRCVSPSRWDHFFLQEGDITDLTACEKIFSIKSINNQTIGGIDYVLHQAALGSVPRSIENPLATNKVNIQGFLNVLETARIAGVKKFVYAASSSTYGDHAALPKREDIIGSPLSPYAVTKYVNELYSDVFYRCYGFKSIGLRYFNVFGPRQNPAGPYSAVIPRWIEAMISGEQIFINGDGETSRDFCFVDNVVQANILAALSEHETSRVYNIAFGGRNSLNALFELLKKVFEDNGKFYLKRPIYREFRGGDVLHSHASIERAKLELGYLPQYSLAQGICKTVAWYLDRPARVT